MMSIFRRYLLKLTLIRIERRLAHMEVTRAVDQLSRRTAYRRMDILQSKLRQLEAR